MITHTSFVLLINTATQHNVCMYGHTYSKSMDQPGMVANPAHGQLNKEKIIFP